MRKLQILLGIVILFLFLKFLLIIITPAPVLVEASFATHKITVPQESTQEKMEKTEVVAAQEIELPQQLSAHFNSADIRELSNLNEIQLESMLQKGLVGLGHAFLVAEQESGVNAAFLVALAALESGWGESVFAKERNNLFGFTAYDNNLEATTRFESHEACIRYVAAYLSEHYLTEGGKYFNGYSVKSISELYATDPHWGSKVVNIANRGVKRVRENE
jgi:beta-N-acetylglucosaminidase